MSAIRLFTLLATVVAVMAVNTVLAVDALPRCAIIVSGSEHTGVIVADLLAAELSAKGHSVVDREHLNQTLGEQVLALAFEAKATAARQKVGRVSGADLLILLTCRKSGKAQAIEWSIASMPEGLRLSSGGAPWGDEDPDELLRAILKSIQSAALLASNKELKILCVPQFVSRNPTFEHSAMQSSLRTLTEELLMTFPGVAVVALEEVSELTTESQLTGDTLLRSMPYLIVGEFTTKRDAAQIQTTIHLQLQRAGVTLAQETISVVGDATLATSLRSILSKFLSAHADMSSKDTASIEIEALRSHALSLVHIGEWDSALPLLRTAALLEPDDLEIRNLIFLTWNGLVTGTARKSNDLHPGYRMSLMEHTLDAFEELVRRKTITHKDVVTLNQFRGHGHLPGINNIKRKHPDVYERYSNFEKRYRGILRGIVDGQFGELNAKTRDLTLRLLTSKLWLRKSSSKESSVDSIPQEIKSLLQELASHPGDEFHIVKLLLNAMRGETATTFENSAFRRDCCPASFERLTALIPFVARLRKTETEFDLDESEFEILLGQVAEEIQMNQAVVDRIREFGRKKIRVALGKRSHVVTKVLDPMPVLEKIPGAPRNWVKQWVLGPRASEYVVTRGGIYRVTKDLALEVWLECKEPRLVSDNENLWLAKDDKIAVLDLDGKIIAESNADGMKFITPYAPGKVLIERHDLSELGTRRMASELWTFLPGRDAKLERQLVRVNDANWTYGVKQPSRRDQKARESASLFRKTPQVSDIELPDFLTEARRHGLGSHPFKFRNAVIKTWPEPALCVEHDGGYYILPGYLNQEGSARTHAVFRADSPDDKARLFADYGWLRYGSGLNSVLGSWQTSAKSATIHEDWLHVLRTTGDNAPHWTAVNLGTGEIHALVNNIQRDLPVEGTKLVHSHAFGLVMLGMHDVYKVTLPPEESWTPYDEAIDNIKLPDGSEQVDPWSTWRAPSKPR
ncbi:MAG: hypothetical protein DHS20C16_12740 [Phycisphaerae bacterium]|nr:MAG: hypothetical protein DHS20C16_12740 [Phycisphaerae bacterium]